MYHIAVYVPKEFGEKVKDAMFTAGGGAIGNYDHCAWQTLGVSQFRPLKGSQPVRGDVNQIFRDEESKIEMICREQVVKAVIAAMKDAHPYETPAYAVVKLSDF